MGSPGTFAAQRRDLASLADDHRFRRLTRCRGLDFTSNDYLGLAGSSELADAARDALARGVPIGAGGSRLLRGNHEEHERLEAEAARLFGTESALYFSTGFAANSALLSTLPQRGDLIIADALIHASAHEGLKLSRAEHLFARHNDAGHVAELAERWRAKGGTGRIWIAVETLYSMDGDRPPLDELVAIAKERDAVLILDEAHAVGVFGEQGLGAGEHLRGAHNVIRLVTCGKAMGCEGALLCCPAVVRDFLINRGRPFSFSPAPSPVMAASVRASLKIIQSQPERRRRLWERVEIARGLLKDLGLTPSGSQILPVILGDDRSAMSAAARLQEAGFDVRGIRPPTVPNGTSRLRISITLNVTEGDIRSLFAKLALVLERTAALA